MEARKAVTEEAATPHSGQKAPTRLPEDQAVRDRITGVLRLNGEEVVIAGPIQRDPHFCQDQNLVVVAGAGSGKTHALVWRMVALVRSGVEPRRIAAITFTRKGAGEMKTRFFEALRQVRPQLRGRIEKANANGDPETAALHEDELSRVAHALENIEHVFIGTIHAFCARLLRERPLEAGLTPGFSTIEKRDEEILRRRFWQHHLRRVAEENPEEIGRLVRMGAQPQELYDFFGELCELDDLRILDREHERPDLEAAVETVRAFVEKYQAERPRPRPHHRDTCMELLDEAEHFLENHGLETDGDRVHLIGIFEKALKEDGRKSTDTDERGRVTPKRWTEADIERSVATELGDEALPGLVLETVRPALRAWRAYLYSFVHRFAADAVEAYEAHRYREGQLTFRDLLKGTARLLRENPDVRRFFQQRYRRLLVDEFQDTDPLQAEVLFYLTGENTEEEDWRTCRPAPGSLFIVGDAKQSIYRFRRADVQVFEEVCRLLEESGGAPPLELTANFRSRPPLCAWCNGTLPRVFEAHAPPYGTEYQPLRPFRDDRERGCAVRVLDVPDVHRNQAAGIAEEEAERIAAFIGAACRGELLSGGEDAIFDGAAGPGNFMILARLSKRLAIYARALEAAGIPYQISGGKALGDSDELRALLRMLECLLRPDDPVALLAFLRGPFCGISSSAFYRFRRAGGTFESPYEVPSGLSEADSEGFRRGFEVLRRMRELLEETTLAAALEAVVESTGFMAWAARTASGSSRAGNVLRLLSIIRRREGQGLTWPEVVEELELLEDGEVDAEQMTLEAGTSEAVRLMTVHKAKGLQAKVVFMADPYDPSHNPDPQRHVERSTEEEDAFAVVPATVRRGKHHRKVVAAPAAWQHGTNGSEPFEEEARRYAAAEHHRIVYVAATRAEDLLVVSRYSKKPDAGFWHRLYPALEGVPQLPAGSSSEEEDAAVDGEDGTLETEPRFDWQALKARREQKRTSVEQATYTFASVTEMTKKAGAATRAAGVSEGESAALRTPGKAALLGTVTHRLFAEAIEQGASEDDATEQTRHLLEEQLEKHPEVEREFDDGERELWLEASAQEAAEALRRFRRSDLWKEVQRAHEVHLELSFAAAGQNDTGRHVTRGVIDLIYKQESDWKIVDFKTDHVPTEEDLRKRSERYSRQLRAYVDHWDTLTEEGPAEAGLWFTRRGHYVPCEVAAIEGVA